MQNTTVAEMASYYIPLDRRHALARGDSIPDRVTGAALFADISGYTPLAERLVSALGPQRGAEELTRRLNRVYDELIRQIHNYGGSVVGFGGDAITCWFTGDDGLCAAACGLAIHPALQDLNSKEFGSGESPLAVKVAISAGTARRFVVGDPNTQLVDVLAGALLDRLAATEKHARPGQVVLDPLTAAQLVEHLQVREWVADLETPATAPITMQNRVNGRSGYAVVGQLTGADNTVPLPELPPGSLTEDQVRPWVIPSVFEHLQTGRGEYLAELRAVTALFVGFEGIDYDGDERAGEKLDAFIGCVQGVLSRYEGNLLQLTMGDKGSSFNVAFGAPVAHDDDTALAANAALDIRAAMPDLPFIQSLKMGITRGTMRTGAYGSLTRKTYGTLGDELNLAARLMQRAAPGQIIASQHVAEMLAHRFHLNALGDISVKGKSKPVAIHELVERQAALVRTTRSEGSQPSSPLIGRSAEHALLGEKLAGLQSKAGATILIEGQAGIGKSRLIQDLMSQAEAAHTGILIAAGDAIEKSTSYFAWRSIVAQLLGLESLAPDIVRGRAQALSALTFDPNLAQFAPLLNTILPLDFPESEVTAQIRGQVRTDNLQNMLLALLEQRLKLAPLLLVVEDAHWLDSASWALLNRVVREVHPALYVITTRPMDEPLPLAFQQLLNAPDFQRVHLEALPPDDTIALISQRLGVRHLPDAVTHLIRDKAEGNPFFSEELAFALRDTGLISIADGECTIAAGVDLASRGIPDTVTGVITSRLDHLTPSQQLTLKVASVIGRLFAFRILRDVEPLKTEQGRLQSDLSMLEHLALILTDTPEPDLTLIFKHIITQEVAYNLMLFAQRRELHREIAEWYERSYPGNLSPYYALLAFHWGQAEIPDKTMNYSGLAGEQALETSAYQEAVDFFTRALNLDKQIAGTTPEAEYHRAQWTRRLGETNRRWGRLDQGREYLELAAALYGSPSPARTGRLPLKLFGEIIQQVRNRRSPPRHVEDMPEDRRIHLREIAQIYELLGELYFFRSERLLALFAAIHTLNQAEAAGPSPELARGYAAMCILAGLFGIRKLAETYYRLAIESAETIKQTVTLADVNRMTALYRLGIGEWDKVEAQLGQALPVHRQLGDKRYWGDSVALLATVAYYTGDLARSDELYAQISTEQHGNTLHQIWGFMWQGGSAMRRGLYGEAHRFLEAGLGLITATKEHAAEVSSLGFLAMTQWRDGEHTLARETADKAAHLISATGGQPSAYYAIDGYVAVADIYLALRESAQDLAPSERESIAKTARQACKALHTYCRLFPIGQPSAWLYQGLCDWLDGKTANAQKAWVKSLSAASKFRMPLEEGRAHYEIGRHLPQGAEARREHLTNAIEIFTRLGTPYELALAQQALAENQHGNI